MRHAPISRLLVLVLLGAGCAAQTEPASNPASSDAEAITDATFLTKAWWDDGQAEVAFYQVERTQNVHGEAADEQFLAGTYLVKHDFDPVAMAKADEGAAQRVPAFKYALFYEIESGSYQYKRSYVVNAARADLAPLKASFTSFDWCSNLYRELAFHPNGTVDALMRSDDYGNRADRFSAPAHAYPAHLVPLLIRSLAFTSTATERAFFVLQDDGTPVRAVARHAGIGLVDMLEGRSKSERIVVTYDAPVPSLIGEESDAVETYWRGTGPDRLLLKMEGETGRYRMTLVEELRTPYWEENLWSRLTRVSERP